MMVHNGKRWSRDFHPHQSYRVTTTSVTVRKMKFSVKDFFIRYEQIKKATLNEKLHFLYSV